MVFFSLRPEEVLRRQDIGLFFVLIDLKFVSVRKKQNGHVDIDANIQSDFFFAVIFWVTYKLPIGFLPKPEYSGKQ